MRVYETKEVACPCCKHDCTATSVAEKKICDVCGNESVGLSLSVHYGVFFDACQLCATTRWSEFPPEIQRKRKYTVK